jgi:hypothetical protein
MAVSAASTALSDQSQHRRRAEALAQGEVNLQTVHHSPKDKSKIPIKGVSVKSQ